ncbi:MAG: hypothetical protein AAF311_11600 [Pseudomonadota bacterium]
MRKLILSAAIASGCLAVAASASAQMVEPVQTAPLQPNADGDYLPDPSRETPLSGQELMDAFSGMTHRGTYNFKRPNIDTFAFVETTSADGTTRHVHGDKVDTGTWRVMANVICFNYDNWDGGTHRACFNIFQRGNCYYHFGLRSGLGAGSFTARSVHAGEIPECEPPMS